MAALELCAADPQLRAMLTTYLTDAALPQGSRVLEVGCGTGAVTRAVAKWPGVSAAVGIDPSLVFVGHGARIGA
jgi:ubiquinone/menaquinone biosynthesis C-methylase UbiE